MKRIAFKMYLKPGQKDEYIRRHNNIWPELRILLNESGINEYSIFLDEETNTLFAFQNLLGENSSQDMGNQEIVQKWWNYMADIMETNDDKSPVTVPLEEVFYMK